MTYCITYKINGIDQIFRMPINQGDDAAYVSSMIRKEFAIIPKLTAKIYGSSIQSTNIISQCVQGQDVVTFDPKPTIEDPNPKLEQYRQVIITPRYESTTTYIVFTTINFKSMTQGDKIRVDIKDTNQDIQAKIKAMLQKQHSSDIKSDPMKILLFLPGGIPFLSGTIEDFIQSFPDSMPHFYAVIVFNPKITDEVLNERYNNVCDISTEIKKILISPVFESPINGLCEMASVLGYIQRNGENVMRMIYSIAKFLPFAPMICGLYSLACLNSPTGMTILQVTVPLSILFIEMAKNLTIKKTDFYTQTTRFLTYFMSIKISTRVPCTEFIKPFYQIGFENYFNNFIPNKMKEIIEDVVAFDPDFRDQDWIKFELPSFTEEDFQKSIEMTKSMLIYPTMSLRQIHRTAIFMGKNGPCLFIAASTSKDKSKKDTIEYINPEIGEVTSGKTEVIAKEMTKEVKKSTNNEYNVQNEDQIDPKTVKQFVFVAVDRSGSMSDLYYDSINQFTAAQEFFIAFANHCYTFHTSSLYGSILFDDLIDVRNPLNSLVTDFVEKMIRPGDGPRGMTHMFEAIERATDIMVNANKNNDYPNAIYRIIVITDGYDNGHTDAAALTNKLIKLKVRVDAILVTSCIEPRLVEITKATGGITFCPSSMQEGLEFFDREEFFNVDMREFGPFSTKNYSSSDFNNLRRNRRMDKSQITSKIVIKQNNYINDNEAVISPSVAVYEFQKEQEEVNKGNIKQPLSNQKQKRIIQELRKIIKQPNPDIQVYPLKNRIDIWRVLIKGPESTPYENKWFYLTVEFPSNYPEHYPLIRFVRPPYHPNITDQGRICLDILDTAYFSNFTIKNLLEEVVAVLVAPNFKDPVDNTRFSLDSDMNAFRDKAKEWSNNNGKNTPDDWKKNWKIEDNENIQVDDLGKASVPPQYLCPITHKILKEPVIATSKVYYEKSALEKYLLSSKDPICLVKGSKLDVKENIGLQIDKVMQTQINDWVKANNYHEDDEENDDDEETAILDYKLKKNKDLNKPKFFDVGKNQQKEFAHNSSSKCMIPPRPRPKLPDV